MIVTILEVCFFVLLMSFGVEDKITLHKKTALAFRKVREKYINLLADIIDNNLDENSVIDIRDKLTNEFQVICSFAPSTTRKSFETTRKRLKEPEKFCFFNLFQKNGGYDFTLSDQEIDLFLPAKLKVTAEDINE